MLIIHVPDNASEYDHQQAREALALALTVQPGTVVASAPTSAPTSERVSQPAKGTPAKGSPEAKARMAKARAAKAAKAGQPSQPKASDRMAELAQRAGIAATPAAPKASKAKATSQRYSLPTWAADIDDADFEALEAFAGRLVDDRKLKAFVLYLQGKADADSLESVASRTGTLRSHAERVVTRARRGESD